MVTPLETASCPHAHYGIPAVMNYTEMESKVREATNNEPWVGASYSKPSLSVHYAPLVGTL